MQGSIYKRCACRDEEGRPLKGCRKAHGSWTFHFETRDPVTGRRRQITKGGFKTRSLAEEAAALAVSAANAGEASDDRRMTLADWLEEWLLTLEKLGRSPKTLANYRGHCRDVWTPQLGRLRLRDVRRAHIERVLTALAAPVDLDARTGLAGRHVERRSTSTIDGYRRTIRAALGAAVDRELIPSNPALGKMLAVGVPKASHSTLAVWEPEQTARFLAHVTGDRLAALYEIGAYAGLRRAELCGLRWSDLDETGLTVEQTIVEVASKDISPDRRVCPSCQHEHVGLLFKGPKSGAGRRWVPLASPARAALVAHRAAQAQEREDFGPDYIDHDLVFCRPDGTPLRPDDVREQFVRHAAACGLPPIRLHDTRHGACSLLLAGGVPIEVVQMILGHSSPAITRQVYRHLLKGVTSAQVETATELLSRHRP